MNVGPSERGFISSMKTLLMLVGAMVVGAALWRWLGPAPPAAPAPTVPRLEGSPALVPVSTDDILQWGIERAPVAVVDAATDALPNGLALAMVSILVDWDHSQLDGADPFVLMRNVYVAGNPVAGRNVLATLRVPLDGLVDVQWCPTPTRTPGGRDSVVMGHAQLRFLFDPADRPKMEGLAPAAAALVGQPDDLILSWEAWRPPQARYDPKASLDPATYSLTVRGYAGAQRFLEDALRGNPWICYPLALPETDDAFRTVFLVAAAMGDSLMRRVMHAMVEDGSLDSSAISGLVNLSDEDLAQLRAVFAISQVPDDPMSALLGKADLSYQLLERSCITQSLTALQWAMERIHREHGLGPAPKLRIIPEGLPQWMTEIAHAGTQELVAKIPAALWFVANNQQVLPGAAWRILDDAAMLKRDDSGEVVSYYYDPEGQTPYGAIDEHLM